MIAHVQNLFQFRELIGMWAFREIRVRYKQSLLGAAWAVLQPLALMLMFTFVFSRIARIPTDQPYPIFSYTALLPWTLFATSISFGVNSLINNMNLVTKTYFPREVLPLGVIGAALFDFLIASSIFVLLMIYYKVPITIHFLWIPVFLVIQIFLMLGIILIGSALTVFYRDVRFIVPLGLQLWMYATPIIYPLKLVEENLPQFRTLYALNPMVGIVESYRDVILEGVPPNFSDLGLAAAVSIILFIVAYIIFKRLEVLFNDLI
ncbi:MAG: ABC transporter permease [Ardenticatenaceae bacterium]|nr:ABC transporter permease [Anaerolineales bacterium]MCB8940800.1 ABC transporter permease [Ardenticatenaceae bacterium]MCB8972139.1 ABC transporter permease [Ardenticatenaceae bacterium]